MFENKVKKLLSSNKVAWGAALREPSNLIAKMTIDTGIDFLWLDTEHCPYTAESVTLVPVLCRLKGCVPVLRVAGLDPNLIKKALDIGASGIIVPQVNNAEEARLAVRYAKYPPAGMRGVSPSWTTYMDISQTEYLSAANGETLIVVQIETPDGIRNLESISEVEGVDVVMAGPADLAACLGHIGNVNHPSVQTFLEEFPGRVAPSGKASGIAVSGIEKSKQLPAQGYRFINIGDILNWGFVGLSSDLKHLKELTNSSS
ncbi:MAG TPA: aldolase/citrate lyase family protein [Terriglobales bacterium]|nr:aldolase/citrate lyase family protein [Terriglobales bacterium]